VIRNALSFDVEDYYQVEAFRPFVRPDDWGRYPSRVAGNTHRLLEVLEAHDVHATFFVLGWVADRDPGLVRAIHAAGHEVACHSYAHVPIHRLSPAEFAEDTRRAKDTIEDAIGARIEGYRAPTFSVMRPSLWALDVLVEQGFTYDSSIFPIHHDRYGIPDAPRFPHRIPVGATAELTEFPITTVVMGGQNVPVGGGGYFRVAPYGLLRRGLRRVNRLERQPVIIYLHPWELDPDQPEMPVGWVTKLRHYARLGATVAKLEQLLSDFAFAPVNEVLADRGLLAVAR
jgi:polysaccharide deacetylase family protein (PEP-CTERM system associated)